MLVEIKCRFSAKALWSCEAESMKLAVEAAVKADADLARADLAGADLAGAYLAGADLAGADLAGADLAGADLAGAYLAGAYLAGADLAGAKGLPDNTPLPESVTLKQFREEVVPALLTAGGKTVAEVLDSGCWECHDWSNCPMHVALGINSPNEAPVLLRPMVQRFVSLFDAGQLPKPVVAAASE